MRNEESGTRSRQLDGRRSELADQPGHGTEFPNHAIPAYGVPSPEGRGTEPAPDSIRG